MERSELNRINDLVRDLSNIYNENAMAAYIEAYDHLIEKLTCQGILPPEYKFLCWLNANDPVIFQPPIYKPTIPVIIEIDTNDFIDRTCISKHKIYLFKKLLNFLEDKNAVFKLSHLDVIIGGSFLNPEKETPSDIDFGILLTEATLIKCKIACESVGGEYHDKELDPKFLNERCSVQDYLSYIWLSMLGNIAQIKDKESEFTPIKNNSFSSRSIYKIRIPVNIPKD